LDPEIDIISRFQASVRNYVRKTLRNPDLHVELSEDYEAFYPILLQNLSKHNVKPTHSLEELHRLRELLPSNLKLFMVLYKNKPIAGSLVFLCNDRVALCFYNMMLYEYAEHKPIHRAMYEVVKFATENSYRYVDLGVSQDTAASNPMTPNMNLIAFKETFDAKTIMRNTLTIKL
jgi:lipid II:glycine glycyltransferase (peptidoglycan interpeptide bridge formation enzyme)